MRLLHRAASVIGWIFRRNRAEARLDDELQAFIELSAAEKIRDGVPPETARRMARLELGGVEQARERVRTYRHGAWLDEAGRDVRYALRMFARTPGFTCVVLLTLALGIGANTAIFSLIDALMLRSLPVTKPAELVQVNLRAKNDAFFGGETLSYPIVRALDARRDIFNGVAGFSSLNVTVGESGSLRLVHGAIVTGGYYQTFGLTPSAGRLLAREDDEPGAPLAAVISDGYWEREYGRSPSVVGQTIRGNGLPITIVGVSPRGFVGADVAAVADITMTVATLPRLYPNYAALLGKGTFFLRALARPAAGVTAPAAAARLNAAWPAMSDEVISPNWDAGRHKEMAESIFVFEPGATGWTGLRAVYRQPLYVLMAVAGLVLLVACANVASLFLARASSRQREIAVRLAIGAGRRRIIQQLVTEGVLVSFAGAALGIAVAGVTGRFLVDLISTGPFKVVFDLTPNWHVLGFSAALATATGIVFGLTPAFSGGRTAPSAALAAALKHDARTSTGRSRLLPTLVVMQVALSLVLIAGAGLFVRTLRNLQRVDPGFSSANVLIVGGDFRGGALAEKLFDEARRVPGVVATAFSTHTPLDGSSWTEPVVPAEKNIPQNDNARVVAVSPEFFDALTIRIRRGRAFNDTDRKGSVPVAIINQRYADGEFPNQDPIGRTVKGTLMGKAATMEIVGVAADVQFGGLRRAAPATVYIPFAQFEGDLGPSVIMRVRGNVNEVRERVRAALQPLIHTGPVGIVMLPAQVNATIVRDRMMATLAGGFGVLALVLCAVGLYGLLAYSVARSSREIGIRMALGARASSVVARVVGNGTRLVAIGFALGLPAAWLASKSVSTMLFGLRPGDPVALGGAMLLLLTAALVACYIPARRAARVDPLAALRQE